jgi:hypothetical protein
MKHLIATTLVILSFLQVSAQTDFERFKRAQQSAYSNYAQKRQADFANYRDSINRAYADFLKQAWEDFPSKEKQPLFTKPIQVPPIAKPETPKPRPMQVLPDKSKVPERPQPEQPILPKPQPQSEIPQPTNNYIQARFLGTNIRLQQQAFAPPHLADVSDQSVARYWLALSELPLLKGCDDINRIKTELLLNDWGMYLLIEMFFSTYFPRGTKAEKAVFTVFMLNQLGYKAKVGRINGRLYAMIAFRNEVTNTIFITNSEGVKYTILNNTIPSPVGTCPVDYPDARNYLDLSMPHSPRLTRDVATRQFKDGTALTYNSNLTALYRDYPCMEFTRYAEAAMDEILLASIRQRIEPQLRDKSQEDAVNLLLNFVQNDFEYKTDDEQFGHEKFFFPEETIASAYSDCEDRSILFSQLVRNLLGMKVVLLYYKGVHLATAIHFDNPATSGDYVMFDGGKYIICDPTYQNATLGMSMPALRDTPVNILPLNNE